MHACLWSAELSDEVPAQAIEFRAAPAIQHAGVARRARENALQRDPFKAPGAQPAAPPMTPRPLQLGRPTKIPASPAEAVLDRVANPHPGTDYVARFTFPEFTSLCPVTGQPDFAIVVIDYLPRRFLIESKSLKLYLNSFRNHAVFHEDCTVTIGKRLVALLKPRWLRIGGYFHPRGGMPIDVFWQAGRLPRTVWVPDQGVRAYRGRE
jgi:7-cyano-7-deazaguanine reductase